MPLRAVPKNESGGAEGNRTPYLLIANEALYQMSYGPTGERNSISAALAVNS